MTDKISEAIEYTHLVAFPNMELGAGGTIVANDGRVVAKLNLKALTLSEAFAFGKAFIAAGAALDEVERLRK